MRNTHPEFIVRLDKQVKLWWSLWRWLFCMFVKHALVRHRCTGRLDQLQSNISVYDGSESRSTYPAHRLLVCYLPTRFLGVIIDRNDRMEIRRVRIFLPRRCSRIVQRLRDTR